MEQLGPVFMEQLGPVCSFFYGDLGHPIKCFIMKNPEIFFRNYKT